MLHNNTVLTAADVRRIIKHAKAAGLNRHLSELAVQRLNLDPDGFSIMSIVVPYRDYQQEPAYHRVNAFLAVREQTTPEEIPMDVLAEDWDALPEAANPGETLRSHLRNNMIPEEALRILIRKWISRMNHPQLSKNWAARHVYEGCIIDLQDLIKETQDV